MSTLAPERPATRRARNGGVPARRAVIRWALRLLRREWRQQLLILALITVAVGGTVVGSAVATTTPSPAAAGFGTAQDLATFAGPGPRVAAGIASLSHRFGTVDVIENQTLSVPGTIQTYSLRAQNPHGPFGAPMLSLITGQFPAGAGQVAVTSGVASDFHLTVGSSWTAGGVARKVTGIVANPQSLLDEFALVTPGQVSAPTQVTVLFDAPGVAPADIGPTVATPQSAARSRMWASPETISLAAAVLGMLLIAMVGAGGFTVLAQRRLRSIGMLAAQGATVSHIRLVVRANGVATGVVGAMTGFVLGLVAWIAYRPHVQASAHHTIGVFQLPWTVVGVGMILAVLAAYAAAARPARAITRVPVVAALAGRPPAPKPARHLAVPIVGLGFLAVAFFLLGLAGAGIGANAGGNGSGTQNTQLNEVLFGLIALVVAVVLLSPACLAVLALLGRWTPVTVRLALRDLARYRARSGPALAAISLAVLIAAIVSVLGAARFGGAVDYVGPNLSASQVIVYPPGHDNPNGPPPTASQLAATRAAAQRIAASVDDRYLITLETPSGGLQYGGAGRSWSGTLYVATPQLLTAFGITPAQVNPGADFLTMRPGLPTTPHMQLWDSSKTSPDLPCPPGSCVANPPIQEIGALPAGTSAPNTVITEHAMREFRFTATTAGWLILAPDALTAAQVTNASQTAAAAGASVETVNNIPSLAQITAAATIFVTVLALGILAMSIGLVRSETASDLRTLTAAGASGAARRTITAATAGALALTGAVVGTAGGYLAVIGFFRTNSLDQLSELDSVPVAELVWILVGLPLIAVVVSWLLGGREPRAIARQPLE